MNRSAALVSGAGGAIGSALLHALSARPELQVYAISRSPRPEACPSAIHWHQTDYSSEDLARVCQVINDAALSLEYLLITNGMLHEGELQPERALSKLDADHMRRVFDVNAILPMRILSAMTPLLRRAQAPRVVALSARVGSIADNRLGGWYSYRGSKAALNMMMKSAAVEFRRLNKRARLMVFHPGTTDSALSKPFQANVPPEKLFEPGFVATRLMELLDRDLPEGDLAYLDWSGGSIPW